MIWLLSSSDTKTSVLFDLKDGIHLIKQGMSAAFLMVSLTLGSGHADSSISLNWNELKMIANPVGDSLVDLNNDLWRRWDDQSSPTPPIVEGMLTLYGYSDLSYGQVALRAADWEQAYNRRVAVHTDWTDLLLRLRGNGYEGFRDRLHAEGFDCVVATKADDIGRTGTLWLYDDKSEQWLAPLHVVVMDAASESTWEHLKEMANPLDGVMVPWVLEVAKDCLEQRGLERKVENNWSGFVRMVFSEASDRVIHWPTLDLH